WYRRSFEPNPEWKGLRVLLDFGGIMLTWDVYFNGHRVGGTDYGYLGFETDITTYIDWIGPNVIAVRADTGRPENSRWYTGGGLYRDVKAVVTDPQLYFTRHPLYITTPVVGDDVATIRIGAEIANRHKSMKEIPVNVTLTDMAGDTVYTAQRRRKFNRRQRINEYLVDSITLSTPALWDTENPNLYTATITLIGPDGEETDRVEQKFGIRSLDFSPEHGLRLNGKKVLLKGIANHHTLGALGAAAYPAALEKRIRLLKGFGFNHIRTSHNPYSEEFMELCDRYGILVVDELYDKWTQNFAGGRRDWMELWPKDIPEWIKRDRNHPSVVMWSLGNELQQLWELPYADWGVTPYRLQKTLLHRYDTTRPVTVAMHPRYRNIETDSLPAPLVMETDVASYNYRYMYFPGDSQKFPWMIFYQSEANASGMGPNWFGMNLDRVLGSAYWGMIDYLGESGGWPAKGWTQGVFDISLRPKPAAWFIRSYFKPDEPVVHIGVVDADNSLVWNDVQVGT
ncbi:MAG: beta-galactosidase, partial [Duncaniella sp.]|nr:beta-galactosidase [Duncaniella sp.]